MESRMMHFNSHNHTGFALVTVLIITAVALLFGAGSLLLFRYQCQLRIERQHELEKVYAVRSALNYIRTSTSQSEINNENNPFRFQTESGRDLRVVVRPVKRIFPDITTNHLDMADEGGGQKRVFMPKCNHIGCLGCANNYCNLLDYEYGAIGATNLLECLKSIKQETQGRKTVTKYGIMFDDLSATNNVEWWVNVGMRGTGGWLEEDYGRRYYFYAYNHVNETDTEETNDIMRLCIIRNVTNHNASVKVGSRHGWPLSQTAYNMKGDYLGERALVFQLEQCETATGGSKGNAATFSEYSYSQSGVVSEQRLRVDNWPDKGFMGIQISGSMVTLFYISMATGLGGGYSFSASANMTSKTYEYFKDKVVVGGVQYSGTNVVNGKVQAPELRAVFDVKTVSSRRTNFDFLSDFRVTPAYQYDVILHQPVVVGNRVTVLTNSATVAQKIGEYERGGFSYTVLTYDTHGTENKGFRKDEREAERKRNGW